MFFMFSLWLVFFKKGGELFVIFEKLFWVLFNIIVSIFKVLFEMLLICWNEIYFGYILIDIDKKELLIMFF